MADIVPVPNWGGVRQLETNEYATGGLNGNMNEQAKSLAGQNMYSRLYAGLPFDPVFTAQVGGFPIGGKAALDNGDIVRSTVANNIIDPNVDMTGWVIPYLVKSSNLDDVPDKAIARNNLEVMSATEVNTAISNATPPTTPDATETTAGKAKIATTAIARAGVNDTDFLTAKKLRDALNATGSAPVYACRAWVNFNGTGTPSIRNSGNVSSITDNGVGDYTINFTTAMPDANYSFSGFCNFQASVASAGILSFGNDFSMSAGSLRVKAANATTGGAQDAQYITVGVFR